MPEITLKPKSKIRRDRSPQQAAIDMLMWKRKFHEDRIKEIDKRLSRLRSEE